VGFSDFVTKARTGFSRNFWVANTLELFERLAFYGSKAILVVYVAEQVGLGAQSAGWFVGTYGFLVYSLPVLAGVIVDRYGFKKSLLACFSIFSLGYLLIGLAGFPAGKPLVEALGGARAYMIVALLITAIGGSLIKPSIVGTVARTTTPETKSLGYSLYYTLVNLGGAIGPTLALLVRQNLGISYVLVMCAAVSLLAAIGTLLFFTEPPAPADAPASRSMARVLRDMVMVFGNLRFMAFLVIFSGFWVMFWPIFYALPMYTRDVLGFKEFELIETVDAWTIIVVTVPAAALTKKLSALAAMILGFALATCCWFLMGTIPTLPVTVAAIALFAVGEAIQAPRYYEYVADLAPKEKVGTYMGFAFVPVAIGALSAGGISGALVSHYIQGPGKGAPQHMWYVVGAIGAVSTVLMVLYDRLVVRKDRLVVRKAAR
jgi:proton-dependent oligopeptide transporter, POT family